MSLFQRTYFGPLTHWDHIQRWAFEEHDRRCEPIDHLEAAIKCKVEVPQLVYNLVAAEPRLNYMNVLQYDLISPASNPIVLRILEKLRKFVREIGKPDPCVEEFDVLRSKELTAEYRLVVANTDEEELFDVLLKGLDSMDEKVAKLQTALLHRMVLMAVKFERVRVFAHADLVDWTPQFVYSDEEEEEEDFEPMPSDSGIEIDEF